MPTDPGKLYGTWIQNSADRTFLVIGCKGGQIIGLFCDST